MKFVGNYKEWVTDDLMNYLKTNNGETRPVWQPDRWQGHPTLDHFREMARPGYSHKDHDFQQFAPKDMPDFPITMPDLPQTRKNMYWWFIKLLPGQMQAMHIDPFLVEVTNPVRYSLFLQDFIPGHIYVWNDKIITNYKKGDLYEWTDPMCIHGCVNIGYEPRYTFQITLHD